MGAVSAVWTPKAELPQLPYRWSSAVRRNCRKSTKIEQNKYTQEKETFQVKMEDRNTARKFRKAKQKTLYSLTLHKKTEEEALESVKKLSGSMPLFRSLGVYKVTL